MSLADSFPDEYKNKFAERNIKVGVVVRVHVKDANPPKEKRLILVAQSYDKLLFASIFINSEINPAIFPTQHLRDLNLQLTADDRDYLDHNSYADCSSIQKRTVDWLLEIVSENPSSVIGEVSEGDLNEIRGLIKSAKTIAPSIKKIFGLYL